MNTVEYIQQRARQSRWAGIALLVLGVLAMLSPLVAGISITLLIGAILVVSGATDLVLLFRAESLRSAIRPLLFGALSVIAGIFMLVQPGVALVTLTLVLAAYFVASGIMEAYGAFQSRANAGWGWLLASGLISMVLGVLIWSQFPFSGIWAVGLLVGIRLFMTGWLLLTLSSFTKRVATATA